jgi:hypothetical protein
MMRPENDDSSKRGQRASPRTPAKESNEDEAKLAKLRQLSEKLSPSAQMIPELPRGSNGSSGPHEDMFVDAQENGQPSNADIMARLGSMMQNMATKEDLSSLKRDITQETKVTVAEAVDPLKDEIAGVKQDMVGIKTRLAKLEESPGGDGKVGQSLTNRISVMEKEISELRALPVQSKDQSTAVVGGLQNASSADAAKAWLREAMNNINTDGVIDVYDKCKGREFNGMVFVKFGSVEKRDAAITVFNASKTSFADAPSYMNRDLPIQHRAKFSYLLGLKKLLMQWEFGNCRFDDDTGILSVGGLPVLQAAVEGFTFKLEWLDEGWGKWEELTKDPKFMDLAKTAEDKLTKASQSSNKGKGKAKSA